MKRFAGIAIFLLVIASFFVIADSGTSPANYSNSTTNSSGGSNMTNSTPITCNVPICDGRINTGEKDSNGCYIYACPTTSPCTVPDCDGRQDTGQKDSNGCAIYVCQTQGYTDMNSCLDSSSTNYWDQKTNKCYSGFSNEIIPKLCSDPDAGINKYESAHTFGFRSNFADSRDQRIRTGGKDGCFTKTRLSENYCDDKGFIQTTIIDCPNGCEEGKCIKGEFISEQITCNFKNSEKEQECYASIENQKIGSVNSCKGINSCSFKFNSEKNEKVTWKSSCGGYGYTIQDGNDESVEFNCGIGETTPGKVINNGYMGASWQCNDGRTDKATSEKCEPYNYWWNKANFESCGTKLYEPGANPEEKYTGGVNSFSVLGECYAVSPIEANSSTGGGASGGGSSDDDFCDEYIKECKSGDDGACEK